MSDTVLLALCAAHSFALAVFHLMFWRLFRWREELPRMSVPNRAILPILNLRLTYVFIGVGALCIAFPRDLVGTPLGRAIMLGMAGFWLCRLIEQFVYLRIDRPAVHALSAVFALGTVLFAWPALRALS
jgi:hypothetical protein